MTSQAGYDLHAWKLNSAGSSSRRNILDDGKSIAARIGRICAGTQTAFARGRACARRGRGAKAGGCCGRRETCAQRASRPQGAGTNPIWRLGKQGHRLGFLSPIRSCARGFLSFSGHSGARVKRANPESRDSPMRNCASEVSSFGPSRNDQSYDQRVTTTVVPTDTRWKRSVISGFSMRMQP